MIKNPTMRQRIFYFVNLDICQGPITRIYQDTGNVEILYWHYRKPSEIYLTKQSAEKHLHKAYAQALKTLNKEIAALSKKREKLASKLAKLLEKG
jgi:hypothetical protein